MALPTILVTTAGTITLGVPLASLTVDHDGHQHVFHTATIVALQPYGTEEVRYEIRDSRTVGVEADEVSAFSLI